ncbi:MAG: DNA mismatch endonuclease Vsr [Planctomycetes bacterium]|nr:DNA mismatch endonuclease Vsr [Planctomycetota bacterium]
MDTLTKERRSEVMGLIRNKDTVPELVIRRLLHGMGYRFRLHGGALPGRPDIVLRRWKAVIFVHGCFWHRHKGCPKTRTPKSRIAFWEAKFDTNMKRDREAGRKLRRLGWRVLVIWECQLQKLDWLRSRIETFLEEEKPCVPSNSSRERAGSR